MTATSTTYGVLGAGALGRAIVTGLCEGVTDPPAIVLSPRSTGTASAALAARFETVSVAADNQAVLDTADLVVVCLRRAHADVLAGLTWPSGARGRQCGGGGTARTSRRAGRTRP